MVVDGLTIKVGGLVTVVGGAMTFEVVPKQSRDWMKLLDLNF